MSVAPACIERLAREAGRSLKILRRRLSRSTAIGQPVWARDHLQSLVLIPLSLAGAWRFQSDGDNKALAFSSARPDPEALETDFSELAQLEDSPEWSDREFRGVTSVLDALSATARWATSQLLDRFFRLSANVLSQSDPALELPETQQWDGPRRGRVRAHFEALRKGVSESLAILAVHGNRWFGDRLGIDAVREIAAAVRSLMTPLRPESLVSLGECLPLSAEAAPDDFLQIVEDGLKGDSPPVLGLLEPLQADVSFRLPSEFPV
ncbi:MAG: hypothetical protein OXN89_07235 [Bryobacterales bacterium]|nr:hypothetical protein [Bryobacterales bacterium]